MLDLKGKQMVTGASRTWAFSNPTKLTFGDNALGEFAAQLKAMPNIERCLLVIGGNSMVSHGHVDLVAQQLHPLKTVTYSGIAPEPAQSHAEQLRAEIQR